MFKTVPQSYDVELLFHLIHCPGRVGRLDRLNSKYVVQEVDTFGIHFDGCHVKSGIFCVATKNPYPRPNFKQSAALLILQDGLHTIDFLLRYRSQLK